MKTENNARRLGFTRPMVGCGTCAPAQCRMGQLMEKFPGTVKTRLAALSNRLNEFCRLCEKKANGGKITIDPQLKSKLSRISDAIRELREDEKCCPELPRALSHIISKNGNGITKHFFLRKKDGG